MNSRTFPTLRTELNELGGYVRLRNGHAVLESRVTVGGADYSAHVAVAPSNYSVKLPAAGFGPGLEPLARR